MFIIREIVRTNQPLKYLHEAGSVIVLLNTQLTTRYTNNAKAVIAFQNHRYNISYYKFTCRFQKYNAAQYDKTTINIFTHISVGQVSFSLESKAKKLVKQNKKLSNLITLTQSIQVAILIYFDLKLNYFIPCHIHL